MKFFAIICIVTLAVASVNGWPFGKKSKDEDKKSSEDEPYVGMDRMDDSEVNSYSRNTPQRDYYSDDYDYMGGYKHYGQDPYSVTTAWDDEKAKDPYYG